MFERIAPEQHDTLDGIPEPSENPELFGHGEAASMLAAAYRAGKLPHALLLAGPLGVGKATLAFHLAYHLLKHPAHENAPADAGRARSGFGTLPPDRHRRASLGAASHAPAERKDQRLQDGRDGRRDKARQPLPVDDLA